MISERCWSVNSRRLHREFPCKLRAVPSASSLLSSPLRWPSRAVRSLWRAPSTSTPPWPGSRCIGPAGIVNYYVDQGPLNSQIGQPAGHGHGRRGRSHLEFVPTAAVALTDSGSLNEDVNGANVIVGNQVFEQPADVAQTATVYPLAIVYDADGSVIDAIFGCRRRAIRQAARTTASSSGSTTSSPTPPSPTQSSCSMACAPPARTSSR